MFIIMPERVQYAQKYERTSKARPGYYRGFPLVLDYNQMSDSDTAKFYSGTLCNYCATGAAMCPYMLRSGDSVSGSKPYTY